jgi:hypothetical protein
VTRSVHGGVEHLLRLGRGARVLLRSSMPNARRPNSAIAARAPTPSRTPASCVPLSMYVSSPAFRTSLPLSTRRGRSMTCRGERVRPASSSRAGLEQRRDERAVGVAPVAEVPPHAEHERAARLPHTDAPELAPRAERPALGVAHHAQRRRLRGEPVVGEERREHRGDRPARVVALLLDERVLQPRGEVADRHLEHAGRPAPRRVIDQPRRRRGVTRARRPRPVSRPAR